MKNNIFKSAFVASLISVSCVCLANAQPTYEEDMARQRAEWQRNQEAYQHQVEEQNAAEEEYYREEEERYSSPQIQYSKNHFAMATNKNYDEVWASWNHPNENAAKNAALKACKNATKSDCTLFYSAWNSSVAVARAPDGFFDAGWGRTPEEAQEAALKFCGSDFCTIYKTYDFPGKPVSNKWIAPQRTNGIDDDFPINPMPHLFTIAVKPKENAPFDVTMKTWFGSGYRDFETGKKQLLDLCKSKTNFECEVMSASSNSITGFYLNENTGSVRYVSGANSSIVENIMDEDCAKNNSKCHVFDTLDPNSVTIKEFNRNPRKIRGYLAYSVSQQVGNQERKLIVSLGNNSLDKALSNAQNICMLQTNVSCSVEKDVDDGTYVYFGLYYTPKKNVRWFFGSSEEGIENYAINNCKNCEKIAIIDARENGTRSFNLHN